MAWRPDKKVNAYGEPTYWDSNYEQKRKEDGLDYKFEWYVDHEALLPVLESYFGTDKSQAILIIGAGTSEIPEKMYEMGFRRLTCIDISPIVVSHMQTRYKEREGLDYICMDVRKMAAFPDNSFDAIIDKGTMDALFCSYRCMDDVLLMNQEVCRVLAVGKVFLEVSHGHPEARLPYLRHHSLCWDPQHIRLPTNQGINIYHMTKLASPPTVLDNSKNERRGRRAGSLDLNVVRDLNETLEGVRDLARQYSES
mmetsp:Transcript_544/g.704  ORF Transcript_544/g.704 Transcript_544/m.704 type:complete len:253 (+) Transcript_544:167-925(+)